jgi:NAD(P)-dependent dehydrogenase (short-subunit alcohol dehydrogenase family)
MAFAAEGALVWATDISAQALASLSAEVPSIQTALLDVTDSGAVQAFARERGAIDVLFNCAGFVHAGALLDCTEDDWDFSFDLNVKSMYRTISAFLPAMIAGGGGSIINMSSVASSIIGAPGRCVYGATKAARHRFDKIRGRRLHHPGYSLQRDMPRHCRVTVVGTTAQVHGRLRKGAQGIRRQAAPGAHRPAPGDRQPGRVPGER